MAGQREFPARRAHGWPESFDSPRRARKNAALTRVDAIRSANQVPR
jgi:hypothetical protein